MEILATGSSNNGLLVENYPMNVQTTVKENALSDTCIINSNAKEQEIYYETYGKIQNTDKQISSSFGKEIEFKSIEEVFPYQESNVFIAEDYGERYVHRNFDKINYVAQQLLKQGAFDKYETSEICKQLEEEYPFEGDSIWMKKDVIISATAFAFCYCEHNNLKKSFEDAGVTAATLSIDAKGEITVEAADGGDLEQLKKTLITKSSLFLTISSKGIASTMLQGSPEEKEYWVTETRWMLWHQYGLRISDMIDENGRVKELPERLRGDADVEKHYAELILYAWHHGMIEDTVMGKLTYVNGRLYVR